MPDFLPNPSDIAAHHRFRAEIQAENAKAKAEHEEQRRRLIFEELEFEVDYSCERMSRRALRARLEELEKMRLSFAQGNKWEFFGALAICAETPPLPMPAWVREYCLLAIDAVWDGKVRGWDEFFGRPWAKSTNMPAVRRNIELAGMVDTFVGRLHRGKYDKPAPIDDALFERVGDFLGIGTTLTKKLYYQKSQPRPYA